MFYLYTALAIYGLGVMFVGCMALYALADLIAKDGFSKRFLVKAPKFIMLVAISALIWPYMLFSEPSFRASVINCGMVMLPFGYLFCVLATFSYPWIWAWYIIAFTALILLRNYHDKTSPEEKTI